MERLYNDYGAILLTYKNWTPHDLKALTVSQRTFWAKLSKALRERENLAAEERNRKR